MDKEKLKGWLFKQSIIYTEMKACQNFDENIYSLIPVEIESKIHIRGALSICETLNIPFTMEDWSSEGMKAERVTFEWNGVRFFTLENFRVESEVK